MPGRRASVRYPLAADDLRLPFMDADYSRLPFMGADPVQCISRLTQWRRLCPRKRTPAFPLRNVRGRWQANAAGCGDGNVQFKAGKGGARPPRRPVEQAGRVVQGPSSDTLANLRRTD